MTRGDAVARCSVVAPAAPTDRRTTGLDRRSRRVHSAASRALRRGFGNGTTAGRPNAGQPAPANIEGRPAGCSTASVGAGARLGAIP